MSRIDGRGFARFATASLAAASLFTGAVACNDAPGGSTGDDGWTAPHGTWMETFRDDFDGAAGSAPDPATWNVMVSATNANNECESYTNSRDNSFLDGEGHLILQALRQPGTPIRTSCPPGSTFTSARLDTRGHLAPQYGRIEARIQLPAGAGLWPAFWMLGTGPGRWPNIGEIDVMEERGSTPNTIVGSVHGPEYFGAGALSRVFALPAGTFAEDFHLFAFEWTADGMRWLVDDTAYHTRTRAGMESLGDTWVFDQPFYILLNLAVGGSFGGNPNSSTPFPAQMVIDYVRVLAQSP